MAAANTENDSGFKFPDEVEILNTDDNVKVVNDEIQVEVEDDTPPEDRDRKPATPPEDPTEEELTQYSVDAQKRIKHFTKGYHDERRAKEAAARERDEALRAAQVLVEENKKLRSTLQEGNTALVEQTRTAVEAELEAARKELREAHESFDPDLISAAQENLLDAKLKLEKLNSFKKSAGQPETSEVQTDRSQQKVDRPEPDKKALAWQQRNQWFGKDVEMSAYVLGLHNKLVSEGVDPRSDGYYEKIDSGLRKRFPENFEDTETETSRSTTRSPVAPVSRSTAPKKIVLTKTQVALANKLGVPLAEYAKQVVLANKSQ